MLQRIRRLVLRIAGDSESSASRPIFRSGRHAFRSTTAPWTSKEVHSLAASQIHGRTLVGRRGWINQNENKWMNYRRFATKTTLDFGK